jgi:hypothetical protein
MKLSAFALSRGLLATAFALVTLTAASAADTFEGRVHMEMTAGKKTEPMGIDYAMKNGKMRCDMGPSAARSGEQEGTHAAAKRGDEERDRASARRKHGRRGGEGMGGMIMDFERKEIIILMENDGEKMFMRRSMAQTMEEAAGKDHAERAPVATGRTEMIAGYKAAEYAYTDDKGEVTDLWLAKGLGTFMFPAAQGPMGGRGAASPGWEKLARDGGFFPLRVVGHDTKGNEKMRMEVTKIDQTPVPDSLFSTEGYTEFQMPDFGGGFNPFKR